MLIWMQGQLAVKPNMKGVKRVTDKAKFMEIVELYGRKMYEVSAGLGMSPQTLYNKLGNTSDFTAPELSRFKDMFPEVSDETFNEIFFAKELANNANE